MIRCQSFARKVCDEEHVYIIVLDKVAVWFLVDHFHPSRDPSIAVSTGESIFPHVRISCGYGLVVAVITVAPLLDI